MIPRFAADATIHFARQVLHFSTVHQKGEIESEPNTCLATWEYIDHGHFTSTISVRCLQIIHFDLDPHLFSPLKGREILSIPFCSLA
jgi:hypothetical protein